jgi:hypothetical protein
MNLQPDSVAAWSPRGDGSRKRRTQHA